MGSYLPPCGFGYKNHCKLFISDPAGFLTYHVFLFYALHLLYFVSQKTIIPDNKYFAISRRAGGQSPDGFRSIPKYAHPSRPKF